MNEAMEIPPRREAADVLDDVCQTIDVLILSNETIGGSLQEQQLRLFRAVIAACRHGVSVQTISRTLILGIEGPEIDGNRPFDDAMEAVYERLCSEAYQTDFETIAAGARKARASKTGPKLTASDRLQHNAFATATGVDCPEIYSQLLEMIMHMRLVPCFDVHPRILSNTAEMLEDALRPQPEESPEKGLRGALERGRKLLSNRRLTKQLKTFELRFAGKVLRALENGVSPVLIAGLIRQEIEPGQWPNKPDAKMPRELVARLGMPHGGVSALQEAETGEGREDYQVSGALMMLAFLFDLRVPRRVVEEMGRTVDHLAREVRANVN